MRTALVIGVEVVALVLLLAFAAYVAIPWAAPPPTQPTPTLPRGALRDCPLMVPACR